MSNNNGKYGGEGGGRGAFCPKHESENENKQREFNASKWEFRDAPQGNKESETEGQDNYDRKHTKVKAAIISCKNLANDQQVRAGGANSSWLESPPQGGPHRIRSFVHLREGRRKGEGKRRMESKERKMKATTARP